MNIVVLDHGYVKFVEAFGCGLAESSNDAGDVDFEAGIIEAARQSTQGSFRGWDEDEKLLRHLYKNKHDTPFEFAGMVIEVQAPLFVLREWHRHRTQSYNEMSARYEPLPDIYYRPAHHNVMERAYQAIKSKNKQAQGSCDRTFVEESAVISWLYKNMELQRDFEEHYKQGLNIGIPKEIARINMPVAHYSRMRASANLRNWLAFMRLRLDEKAQWEIRQYAIAVGVLVKQYFPKTFELFAVEMEI